MNRLMASFSRLVGVPAKVSVSFADGQRIEAADWANIESDSTMLSSRISSIELSASTKKEGRFVRLSLDLKDSFFHVAYLSCSGEKSLCLSARKEVDDELRPCSAWYAVLYAMEPWIYILPLSFGALLGLVSQKPAHGEFGSALISTLLGLLAVFAWHEVIKLAFPRLVFSFGLGGIIQSRRVAVLKFLFIAVFVSLCVGVAVNVITSRWIGV